MDLQSVACRGGIGLGKASEFHGATAINNKKPGEVAVWVRSQFQVRLLDCEAEMP